MMVKFLTHSIAPMIYNDLFATLTTHDLVLTVNRRLATFLRDQYALYQQKLANKIWLSPDILPFSSWLTRCWEQSQSAGVSNIEILLNNVQEQIVWEQIIRNSPAGENLLQIASTAQLAKQAWQLTKQWQVDIHSSLFALHEDTLAWQKWAKEFENLCRINAWIDSNSLLDRLTALIKQKKFPGPHRIFLVGFDEITPQCHSLLSVLTECNCEYHLVNSQYPTPHNVKITLADTETEIRSLAQWAHTLWRQETNTSIGIVIPNLTEIRSTVVDIFHEIFAPENKLPGYYQKPLPFNIAAGLPLKNYPIIGTALLIVGLVEEISLEELNNLLHSPYIGHAEQEMAARAQLDALLRKQSIPRILDQHVIATAKKNNCPLFAQHLQSLIHTKKIVQPYSLPSEWAELFSQQLACLGWPGERSLNSAEYQSAERWAKLLTEFASLDRVIARIPLRQALKYLNRLAANTLFQPQSPPAPIQILGVLEAAGLHFQHLWVMGLHDQAWPLAASPNPFIPLKLQRERALPHASNERELQFCQAIIQRLFHGAPNIVTSFPQYDSERKLRPSPFLHNIQPAKLTDLRLPVLKSYVTTILESAQLEPFIDNIAPPLTTNEKISGGTAIFKYQAACPFRAFARFRLGAQGSPLPQAGLSAIERGLLLHHALEILWNKLGSHEQLSCCDEMQLKAIINQAITSATRNFTKKRPDIFKKQFLQIEKQRLCTLLSNWLTIEKQRSPFTVVTTEQTLTFTVNNISLQLKVDRIDQLPDGSHFIIDYKTGVVTTNAWLGERPDEPQLLLYCLAYPLPVSGLGFAQITGNTPQLKSITTHDVNNWDMQLAEWRNVLEKLAEHFAQGHAQVDPKYGEKTCQFCELQTLCRLKSSVQFK